MLESMRGGLIDYLWTGVKVTYIAIFATSFATMRSSSTQGCSIFQQNMKLIGFGTKSSMGKAWRDLGRLALSGILPPRREYMFAIIARYGILSFIRILILSLSSVVWYSRWELTVRECG